MISIYVVSLSFWASSSLWQRFRLCLFYLNSFAGVHYGSRGVYFAISVGGVGEFD